MNHDGRLKKENNKSSVKVISLEGVINSATRYIYVQEVPVLLTVAKIGNMVRSIITCTTAFHKRSLQMNLGARKPVFGVSVKASFKQVSSATETS